MATIVLATRHAGDRSAASDLLRRHPGWTVVEASGVSEALRRLASHEADLLLTDTSFSDEDSGELLRRLRRAYPYLPVVMLSSGGPAAAVVRALRLGAASYVPRSMLARDLVSTVSRVLALCEKGELEIRILERRLASRVAFEIENDATLFRPLVGYFQDELEGFGLGRGEDRVYVGVAVEEALLNAMIHGNLEIDSSVREQGYDVYDQLIESRRRKDPYRQRRIRIVGDFDRERAIVTIRVEGKGFDVDAVPNPLTSENMDRVSGRGLLLIRTFMDEVRFNDKGNEVELVKRRPQSPLVEKSPKPERISG